MRSPSPRPTSAASSSAQLERETSTPSRRDETDKSVERSKDESPVRRTPARKKRARKISSDSDGVGSGSSSSSDSSSSEDEAMAEDKVIDRSEEEQLRVLEEKRAAHKRLKSRMKKKAMGSLIRKVKKYEATMRKSQETEKEAEKTEAEQQEEEEAVEAETPEADLAVTEREERSRKERSARRIVRERHIKDRLGKPALAAGETSAAAADRAKGLCRLGKPAPPAAGETSEAVADSAERLRRLAGYKIPRLVSPIRKCYLESFETLPTPMEDCIVRAPETTQERLLFGILVDAGMVLSGKQAASYIRPHFRFQRREDNRKYYSD